MFSFSNKRHKINTKILIPGNIIRTIVKETKIRDENEIILFYSNSMYDWVSIKSTVFVLAFNDNVLTWLEGDKIKHAALGDFVRADLNFEHLP